MNEGDISERQFGTISHIKEGELQGPKDVQEKRNYDSANWPRLELRSSASAANLTQCHSTITISLSKRGS